MAPRALLSLILEGRREKEPAREMGLDEVLVASVEATHKVLLQHLSQWQPHLPSSVDYEGRAQGRWVSVHACLHVCTCVSLHVHVQVP